MSDFGLQVFSSSGKAINVGDAAPLQFVRRIDRSEVNLNSGASSTFDFRGVVPAGVQLVVWTDVCAAVLESATVIGYNVQPINIDVNDRVVTISLPGFGTGNWVWPASRQPTAFWVLAIYQQPVTNDGWGLYVAQGGAFPAVVNSAASLFLTQTYSGPFTGTLQLNCSGNAMVFCNCPAEGIGLYFDRNSRQLIGYSNWGVVGGFSVQLNVCVFDIKTPTIPDWGLMIYGADGGVSFTSAETPLVVRQWASLPMYYGNWSAFSAPGNMPMIQPASMGAKTTNKSDTWQVNLAMNNNSLGYGPGLRYLHVGTNMLPDVEAIPYRGKTVPVIWGSDYF